jgi:hypothetical protein
MELLRGDTFHEVSVSNLTGQYVGEAETKTREMFDAALGGVLFIDEAYRLADSTYGAQVLNEIVDMATKEKYMGKMCLILAGYPSPTLKMLKRNPGALGRFGDNIIKIPDPTPAQCAKQFWRHVERLSLSSQAKQSELSDVVMRIIERFSTDLEHFAFYRDVETFVESADTHIGRDLWTEKRLEAAADRFIGKRETAPEDDTDDAGGDYSQNWMNAAAMKYAENVQDRSPTKPTTVTRTVTAKKQEMQHECECAVEEGDPEPETAVAASGLNDATAMRSELGVLLEEALEKGEIDEHEFHEIFAGSATCWDDLPDAIKTFKCSNTKFKLSESNYSAEYSKLMNNIQVAQEEARKLAAKSAEAAKIQQKLLGLCPVGFAWTRTATGYVCGGGSHYADADGNLIG